LSAPAIARAYDLIIFPGHHEYVTQREFTLIRRYRDLGGNLVFLSANNFYWRVAMRGDTIERTARFRDIRQPEIAVLGKAYAANDGGGHMKPWVIRNRQTAPWLFAGTDLRAGSDFALGGIEVDETGPGAPPGTRVIAAIPQAIGRHSADMTYYERGGAKVFCAGAFTLAGEATWPTVRPVLDNLWEHMRRR